MIQFIDQCLEHCISFCPSNQLFSDLRWQYYRRKIKPGSGYFSSHTGLFIACPEKVYIGNNVSINQFVFIDACDGGNISIGDDCLVGPYVLFRSADHRFDKIDIPIKDQNHQKGNITIGNNCWIGGHVTITCNVSIGEGCVIGANSVVTKSIPPFSVAVGTPAKVIRNRRTSP